MTEQGDEILLCCLLWAHPHEAEGLRAYEDEVLALISRHGGKIVQRAQSFEVNDQPDEVQFFRFKSKAALDSYLSDPARTERADERDRVIARTELFPVHLVSERY